MKLDNFIKCVGGFDYQGNPIRLMEHISPELLVKLGFEEKEIYSHKGNGYDYQPEDNNVIYKDYVYHIGEDDDFVCRFHEWNYVQSNGIKYVDKHIHIIRDRWYHGYNEGDLPCKEPKYMHEIQLLFFALTGKELKQPNENLPTTRSPKGQSKKPRP